MSLIAISIPNLSFKTATDGSTLVCTQQQISDFRSEFKKKNEPERRSGAFRSNSNPGCYYTDVHGLGGTLGSFITRRRGLYSLHLTVIADNRCSPSFVLMGLPQRQSEINVRHLVRLNRLQPVINSLLKRVYKYGFYNEVRIL